MLCNYVVHKMQNQLLMNLSMETVKKRLKLNGIIKLKKNNFASEF